MKISYLLPIALCGCLVSEPVVTDYNGHSVKVRSLGLAGTAPNAEDTAKAQELCSTTGKVAQHVSTVPVAESFADYLFVCA